MFTGGGAGGGGRGGRTSGNPWTIRVATVADGTSRQIWKADPGAGSAFHPVVAENQLVWAAGNRVVFPWEKEGWVHLYSVPVEGGAAAAPHARQLRSGARLLHEDGKEIVYSSNQDDIDRRHIWRVSTAAGPPTPSPRAKPWSGRLFSSPAASRICTRTRANRPARAIQIGSATARDLAPATHSRRFPRRLAGGSATGYLHRQRRHADPRPTLSAAPIASPARSIPRWSSCTADRAARCCSAGTTWTTTTTPTA